jgi:hypothetical protein
MDDSIWDSAVDRAEKAERKPGMTPYRRGVARLLTNDVEQSIAAKLADTRRLPHGRLGTLLQVVELRALAAIAVEAVAQQIGRRHRGRHFELRLKIAIGKSFYVNVGMAKAAKEAKGRKDALAHLRWRRLALEGKLKARKHESPENWLKRLRREREVIWWALTKDASDEELLRAGSWLLQRVAEADVVILTDKGLLPTKRFEQDLRRLQHIIVRANVRLLPLPPGPEHWTQPTIYRSGLKVNFLPHPNKAHQVSITKSFKSCRFKNQHRAAINRLGDVPLRVDSWTLDKVDRYADMVKDYKDEHRRLAYGQEIDRTVAEASRLLKRGAFVNTYHIDFRGRLNSDQGFNYARGDSIRSLYRFEDPAELGNDGFRWLLINAANCYGLDKVSFDERVAWAKEFCDEIERSVESPRSMLGWWSKADKPFAFLAACREIMLAEDNPRFLTRLPIGFDHTASGIQHLALIGLDAKAAGLVNLVDCAAPHDIYAALATRAVELFDVNDEYADYWRQYFKHVKTRKFLKAPGVSFSYASTDRGNVRQIFEAHYKLREEEPPPSFKAVVYLVSKFRQACAELLPGPVQTMEYLQSLARDCNKAGRFVEWTTPSGLHVSNIYPQLNKPTVYLPDGAEYTVASIIPGTIRSPKTKSTIAANFVHSLDASQLVRTVNALFDNYTEVLCVHDCFAVRASHATEFHKTNRQELASMYQEMFDEWGGPLAMLRAQNGGIGDAPPPLGKFKLVKVNTATYACD